MKVIMKKYLFLVVLFFSVTITAYTQNQAYAWGNDTLGQLGVSFDKWKEEQAISRTEKLRPDMM